MANSMSMERDVNRDHFCPKCGERMRKIKDNTGLIAKCPRSECGFDYHIYWKYEPRQDNSAKQLPLFPTDYTDIPF